MVVLLHPISNSVQLLHWFSRSNIYFSLKGFWCVFVTEDNHWWAKTWYIKLVNVVNWRTFCTHLGAQLRIKTDASKNKIYGEILTQAPFCKLKIEMHVSIHLTILVREYFLYTWCQAFFIDRHANSIDMWIGRNEGCWKL